MARPPLQVLIEPYLRLIEANFWIEEALALVAAKTRREPVPSAARKSACTVTKSIARTASKLLCAVCYRRSDRATQDFSRA